MSFNEKMIKQCPPNVLIQKSYDEIKSILESGEYHIDRVHYTKKDGYYSSSVLSYWSLKYITKEKLTLILSFNPDKTIDKKGSSPPLFHVSTFFDNFNPNYDPYTKAEMMIHEMCDKLRIILHDGYDYNYKSLKLGRTLLEYYRFMTDYYRVKDRVSHSACYPKCSKKNKCLNCLTSKLYSRLSKVVRECWLKQITLFELMLHSHDLITSHDNPKNKKQRT